MALVSPILEQQAADLFYGAVHAFQDTADSVLIAH